MKLNILISTLNQGILKIPKILLPYRDDVAYIVSHQYENEKYLKIPDELNRRDVIISQIEGRGLTKSRNNAIKIATGDICIIADDDVTYTNEYFDLILKHHKNSQDDIICFKINTGENSPEYKNYAKKSSTIKFETPYNIKPHFISSIEITFKLNSIRKNKISFDERFGLGSKFPGGEEALFIIDSIKKCLKIQFIPEFIVNHPFESTNKSKPNQDKDVIKINGALDSRVNGIKSIKRTINIFLYSIYKLNLKGCFINFYRRLNANIYILLLKK